MFVLISSPKSSNFTLYSNRSIDKNRSTGMSNGSFVLKWVEYGVFFSRSPVIKTSSCGDGRIRTRTSDLLCVREVNGICTMSVSHEIGLKSTSPPYELSPKIMGSKKSRFSNQGVHWENHNTVYRRNQAGGYQAG